MQDKNEANKNMRMCGKKFFITWSQCPAPKEVAFNHIKNTFTSNVDKLIVGQELHQDGNSHLHGAVWFKKRVDRHRAQRIFDITYNQQVYHPQWEPLKNDHGAKVYVCKDGNIIADPPYNEWNYFGQKKGKKTKIFDEVINKKRPLYEAIKEVDIGMISGYIRMKADLNEFRRDSEEDKLELPTFLPNPWGRVLFGKKNSKKRHYWIFSRSPNKGKTTMFAEPLEKTYRFYIKTGDYTYWNVKESDDGIILDDYNGAKVKYYELNQMCDGTYEYRVFQRGVIKLVKPLIIVLSNQSIKEIYPNMFDLLYARFNEIEIL